MSPNRWVTARSTPGRVGRGHDGQATSVTGSLSTLAPTKVVNAGFQLSDGQTVGIAAPIIIQFDAPITDKATVERALTVTTTPPTEGG